MKILLHICCAPCSIVPLQSLRDDSYDVMGYFYGHNIHPYKEYLKRRETLEKYADFVDLKVVYSEGYKMEAFLRGVVFRETNRCSLCYHDRLKAAAHVAKRGKFDCYTSTLLYSKFQKHDEIRSIGESVGKSVGIPFYYHDFRKAWKDGVEISKKLNMYRQPYCGCIYSEKERYYR